MRKLAFILLILVLVTDASAEVFIKAMGGINLSRFSGEPRFSGELVYDGLKFRTGYELGIGLEIDLSSHIALEIDGFFVQKESRSVDDQFWDYTFKGNSIQTLLKVRLGTDSSPYILVGGEVFFIYTHEIVCIGGKEYYMPYNPEIKSVRPGLVFGCGFEWKKEKISLFVEAMYQLDMTAIFESTYIGNGNIYQMPTWKPRTIVFLIGLKQKIL